MKNKYTGLCGVCKNKDCEEYRKMYHVTECPSFVGDETETDRDNPEAALYNALLKLIFCTCDD